MALWLGRDAGPGAEVEASLTALTPDGELAGVLTLRAGTAVLAGIKPESMIDPVEFAPLLPQMLKAANATVTDGKSSWTLSLAGLHAALLKMDDLQGRLDTTGALVRKGARPDAAAPPARPVPVLRAPPAPAGPGVEGLLAPILKVIPDRYCWDSLPDASAPETSIARLSATQVLVLRECGRGAYQGGSVAWIANLKAPHQPRRALFPTVGGKPADYVVSANFENGVMRSWSKARGIGDCGTSASWLWTGSAFALLSAEEVPLCRGVTSAGFSLRTWVAKQGR